MSKRRVTLNLDEDIVDALKAAGPSLSATVNTRLREAVRLELHLAALDRWLDELDAKYGPPSEESRAAAAALLDEVEHGHGDETSAA